MKVLVSKSNGCFRPQEDDVFQEHLNLLSLWFSNYRLIVGEGVREKCILRDISCLFFENTETGGPFPRPTSSSFLVDFMMP